MMANDVPQSTGEERLRARRRTFIRYCLVAVAIALAAGLASGFLGALVADGVLPVWLVYVTSALLVVGFLWFTRDYLRRVDELDLLDNLWAGFAGFVVYYVAFPIWSLLHGFGLAPPVDGWWLWIGSAIAVFAAYCVRKLGLR